MGDAAARDASATLASRASSTADANSFGMSRESTLADRWLARASALAFCVAEEKEGEADRPAPRVVLGVVVVVVAAADL